MLGALQPWLCEEDCWRVLLLHLHPMYRGDLCRSLGYALLKYCFHIFMESYCVHVCWEIIIWTKDKSTLLKSRLTEWINTKKSDAEGQMAFPLKRQNSHPGTHCKRLSISEAIMTLLEWVGSKRDETEIAGPTVYFLTSRYHPLTQDLRWVLLESRPVAPL